MYVSFITAWNEKTEDRVRIPLVLVSLIHAKIPFGEVWIYLLPSGYELNSTSSVRKNICYSQKKNNVNAIFIH